MLLHTTSRRFVHFFSYSQKQRKYSTPCVHSRAILAQPVVLLVNKPPDVHPSQGSVLLGSQGGLGIHFIRSSIQNDWVRELCHQAILCQIFDRVLNHFLPDIRALGKDVETAGPSGGRVQEFLQSWKSFRVVRVRLACELLECRANSVLQTGAQKWLDPVEARTEFRETRWLHCRRREVGSTRFG